MSALQDFLTHPIEKLERALHLRKQIEKLNDTLKELFGPTPISLAGLQLELSKRTGKRTLSPEARARIVAGQKARWAKSRKVHVKGSGNSGRKTGVTSVTPGKKRGGLSAEGRARIAAAQKARWAKAKKSKM